MDSLIKIATALDNLGARVYRDLHFDSSYLDPEDPKAMREAISGFCAYAEAFLGVLNDPAVRAALDTARRAA